MEQRRSRETMTRIFISHSHSDKEIAFKLVNFLLAALGLKEKDILCTSNPDQGLSHIGSSITDQLKEQLKNSEALIVLITADSLHSAWIPFEAGSFWTTDKPIIPILGPGLTQNDLPGPLKSFLSIPIAVQDAEDRLNNAINQLAKALNLQQEFTARRNYTLREFSDALRAWHKDKVELKSAKGVDYTKLRDHLAAGEWKDADEETAKRMREVANKGEHLNEEDIDNFPCEDLRTIDQLWVEYSNGRFGFSVQKDIYKRLGGRESYEEKIWEEFGTVVGWRKGGKWLDYSKLTFELQSNTLIPQPQYGHLPNCFGNHINIGINLFSRVQNCTS